jgi:hypothetical protein
MNKTEYFWVCSYPLRENSIIEPRNWGRIITCYNLKNNTTVALREYIFEKIRMNDSAAEQRSIFGNYFLFAAERRGTNPEKRLEFYQHRPSRFKSNFVCETLLDIKNFQTINQRIADIIYKVEIIEDYPIFKADWLLGNVLDTDNLFIVENKAHFYWRAEDIRLAEILTLSPLRIITNVN